MIQMKTELIAMTDTMSHLANEAQQEISDTVVMQTGFQGSTKRSSQE